MKNQNNESCVNHVQPKHLELANVMIPKQELQYLYQKIRDYELLIKQYEDQLRVIMDDKTHQSSL